MLLTSTSTKTTLKALMLAHTPTIFETIDKRRIVWFSQRESIGDSYGCYIKVATGSLKISTIVGDIINVSTEGLPLEVDDTLSFEVSDLGNVRVQGVATFYLLLV